MKIKEYLLNKKNYNTFGFLGLSGLFAVCFLIYALTLFQRYIINSGDLVVAFNTSLPPHYAHKESERCNHGFDYSIAWFIAQRLNKNLSIKKISFAQAINELKASKIDLICASMTITDKRLHDMAMIHVYGTPEPYMTLVFWNSQSYEKLSSKATKEIPINKVKAILKNAAIGVITGTVFTSVLEKYKFNNFNYYKNENDLLLALESDEISAAAIGEFAAKSLQKQNPNIQTLSIALDAPWSHGAGIAIKKERTDLIKNVTEVIQDLKDEGIIRQEQLRWFGRVCQ